MPNDCAQRWTVWGSLQERNCFLKSIQSRDESSSEHEICLLDFRQIFPEPPESDHYEWRVSHWGTKWNAYDVEIDPNDPEMTRTTIEFLTAWSPVSEKMIRKFMVDNHPRLRWEILYAERGLRFYGRFGNFGPAYHHKFQEMDFLVQVQSEHDDMDCGCEQSLKLVENMAIFQELYDNSG